MSDVPETDVIEVEVEAPEVDDQADADAKLIGGNDEEVELELDAAEGDEQADEDPDEIELEWNGKKFKAPKEVQAALMKDADYTRKTQEVAATRKELEQAREELNQKFQAAEQEVQLTGVLKQAEDALQQYQSLTEHDWREWETKNPQEAQANWRRFALMKDAAAQGKSELEQLQHARTQQYEQETATRLAATREYAEKNIKGWTPERDAKLTNFATKELGFEMGTLRGALTPQVYRALHLAEIGFQALTKATAKPSTPQSAPVEVLETVKPKGNPVIRKTLSNMSIDEHAALYRKEQEARRRA